MFNILVDNEIADIRERAQMGNFDSMMWLGIHIHHGFLTPRNPELALSIFDHVIAHKSDIPFKETYWEALCQKMHIHSERGEEEIIDELALEMIRHMSKFDPSEWDYGKMEGSVRWLKNKAFDTDYDFV